ncbi:MAG: hypothetical protein LBH43_01300 [Treponema sp.]|nr:hypothetical protein [Treponema sp.]
MIMKKNWIVFPVVLLILAGIVCFAVLSCSDDKGSIVETYNGTGELGTAYKLEVTNNKTYAFFINGESKSTGTVSKSGYVFTLTPNAGGSSFYVTVSGDKITKIEGVITPDDGSDPITPENIRQSKAVAGVWTWALSDDSQPNPHVTPQTVFAPGGASKFESGKYTEDPAETDTAGQPVKRPYIYSAGTVKDNKGNTINATVFNLKGNTKVSSNSRPANSGAQFPMIGWEATPDASTKELLKTAYGYSFWVRLNSATENNWSFNTAVITDYEAEKGYEHKHWYGNKPGDSGGTKINNFTKDLKLGEWYKITVVINKNSTGFNINQDKWMHQYVNTNFTTDPNDPKNIADKAAFDKPYTQSKAEKLQWQIPLQHQVGAGVKARTADPYDITNGSYDFDVDFYGLELIMN